MQQIFSITPPPDPENRCLGCLFMKLEGIPVQPERQELAKLNPQPALTEQITLYLTLQFNEQRERLLSGHITFGLKGGKLHIKLKNGQMPLASRKLGVSINKLSVPSCQVTTKGSQENPAWIFQVEVGEPILKGLLKNAKLGTLMLTAKPCYLEVTFEVSPQDVYLTEAEGLWSKNISPKKRAVIERAIARRFLERKLKPYLSRQVLHYD